jgi:hypothetical protein
MISEGIKRRERREKNAELKRERNNEEEEGLEREEKKGG